MKHRLADPFRRDGDRSPQGLRPGLHPQLLDEETDIVDGIRQASGRLFEGFTL